MNYLFLRLAPAFVSVSAFAAATAGTSSADNQFKALIHGPATCATSGCHGGASERSRQYSIWSQRDVHSKSYNTLTSARSARMAEALKIANPARSATCTACHAPLQTVEPSLLASDARIEDGVGCVSCHGITSEDWLRSHTRPDWTHADRVAAGMRDLRNLYGRANACVACHQSIAPEIVTVGKHPQLVFELDGQATSQPKHWTEVATWQGGQAWYVGQAVALREMSWSLAHNSADADLDAPRWSGLLWVLKHSDVGDAAAGISGLSADPTAAAFAAAVDSCDAAARRAADMTWGADTSRALMKKLASTEADFRDASIAQPIQAYRAERLVLAFDRLLASLPAAERPAPASAALDELFKLSQSIPDFSPTKFADGLKAFQQTL